LHVVLRLITFAGLALTRDGAPYTGAASQRRRLALLAVLATAGPTGVSREKLLAYFWPETEEDQARHALNQALHQIRAGLGPDAVITTSTALALGSGITSDVAEFKQASAERHYERAAALVPGPFLDGFHIPEAAEFERWMTVTRATLAQTWTSIVQALAVAASDRRDRTAVVRWRQLLAAADPLSAPAIIALAEAHVAAGDRSAARRTVTAHDTLVRTELDAEPAAEITEWIARLKQGPQQGPPATGAPVAPIRDSDATPPRDRGRLERTRLERATAGRYTIGAELARGAVLTTFAATDVRDQTPAAVHLIRAQAAAQADPDRFVAVLRQVGTVADPRIVPVLDVGVSDDAFWFATPPSSSQTLRDRLARERQLSIPDAVRLARDLAAGLAAAHARDVTHGDLRPKHIEVLADGVIIGGWALPSALALIHEAGAPRAETTITIAAPAYASPEQLEGHAVPDARSDIYSAGCVLFEVLAGAPPFTSGDAYALVSRKLSGDAPSVVEARSNVPAALDALIRTCLARSPADRYPSGGALAAALEVIPG
jgi:DNA-binding SARP family transcriptional activator